MVSGKMTFAPEGVVWLVWVAEGAAEGLAVVDLGVGCLAAGADLEGEGPEPAVDPAVVDREGVADPAILSPEEVAGLAVVDLEERVILAAVIRVLSFPSKWA